jgi:Escherichia/Staphylococcus phage prohead protease
MSQQPEIIKRSLQLDTIELEGAEGRTLHARLFSWDTISRVSDGKSPYDESWKRGVFGQSIRRAQRLKRGWPLMYNHAVQNLPIGMVSMVHERDDGPWMTSKISRTSLGDDIIELIKDGAIPGVSINGRNIKSRRNQAGVIERMEVALDEISVTPFPALQGADELVLRSVTASDQTDELIVMSGKDFDEAEVEPAVPTKRLELAAYLAQLDDPLGTR